MINIPRCVFFFFLPLTCRLYLVTRVRSVLNCTVAGISRLSPEQSEAERNGTERSGAVRCARHTLVSRCYLDSPPPGPGEPPRSLCRIRCDQSLTPLLPIADFDKLSQHVTMEWNFFSRNTENGIFCTMGFTFNTRSN